MSEEAADINAELSVFGVKTNEASDAHSGIVRQRKTLIVEELAPGASIMRLVQDIDIPDHDLIIRVRKNSIRSIRREVLQERK